MSVGSASAAPTLPMLDNKLVASTALVGGVTGAGAMFTALQVVDRTNRSSSAAAAASALLDVTNGKLRSGMLALGVGAIGLGATDGAGQVQMDTTTRSLAVGAGVAALATEGVHMGYSAAFYPHGGAFKPLQTAVNLAARFERINQPAPAWISIAERFDQVALRLIRR